MKSIDPVEKAAEEQRRKFIQKSSAIGILLASVAGAMLLLPKTAPKPVENGNVLGTEVKQVEKKPLVDQIKSDGEKVKTYVTDRGEKVLSQGQAMIGGRLSEAESTATDFINEKAVLPLVEYLQKLPKDQREYVIQELCPSTPQPTATSTPAGP